jgi:hypothetical protein
MKTSRGRCFNCGARLKIAEIRPSGPFPCPECHTLLQPTEYYAIGKFFVCLLVSILVFLALGIRGLDLFYDVLLAIVPIIFISANFLKYVVPPNTEPYGPRTKDSSLRLRD